MRNLTIPNLRSWKAGDLPSATMLNELQDAYEWAMAPPEVKLIRIATLSVPSAFTAVSVPLDRVLLDNCAPFGAPMWTSALPTRVYCQVAGWYEITISFNWNISNSGNRRITAIKFNGTNAIDHTFGRNDTIATGDVPQTTTEFPWFMNVGDYMELVVYSDVSSQSLATQVLNDPTDQRYAALVRAKWVSA